LASIVNRSSFLVGNLLLGKLGETVVASKTSYRSALARLTALAARGTGSRSKNPAAPAVKREAEDIGVSEARMMGA
jgi:hypothetical protein